MDNLQKRPLHPAQMDAMTTYIFMLSEYYLSGLPVDDESSFAVTSSIAITQQGISVSNRCFHDAGSKFRRQHTLYHF